MNQMDGYEIKKRNEIKLVKITETIRSQMRKQNQQRGCTRYATDTSGGSRINGNFKHPPTPPPDLWL